MLSIFVPAGTALAAREAPLDALPQDAVWLDLLRPEEAEERAAEAFLGADVPTHEERVEIETSSRLYEEDNALVMSATVLYGAQREHPGTTVATFILAGDRLATVRYDEPSSFAMARQRCIKPGVGPLDGKGMFLVLLDAIVDRVADVLELAGTEADRLSREIFEAGPNRAEKDYDGLIRQLGRLGTLLSKSHESLVSLSRLILFFSARAKKAKLTGSDKAQLKSLARDIHSLNEYADTLDNKISFLLEATLGLVNLQQNQAIKIFSVLAVVFLPPTLIASIYGMNFARMPELALPFGYPMAIAAMVASAVGTWAFFRWKRWL